MQIRSERRKLRRYIKSYLPFWHKTVGFYENLGHGDIGDDAAFFVAQRLLGRDLMPVSKRCYAFNPARYKALLIGGRATFRWECPYIPRRIFIRKKWNFPVILFAAGVNRDYDTEISTETKESVSKLCVRCDYVTVRDSMSEDFLHSLGIRNVSLLPDPELALEQEAWSIPDALPKGSIGITLSPHSAFSDTTIESIIAAFRHLANYMIEQGEKIIFFPFDQPGCDSKREAELIRKVRDSVDDPESVYIVDRPLSPRQMLYAIKSLCKRMICMRMHSAAFSANAGVPFVCVGFNDMHRALVSMLDVAEVEVSLFSPDLKQLLIEKYHYVEANDSSIKKKLSETVPKLQRMIVDESVKIRDLIAV